ncbi:MAG: GNAT family N-acetyltransferase [Actinomycetales bacterium]|nr:GNAT family N-acetyltransferase [Actinomycetales bacterium]
MLVVRTESPTDTAEVRDLLVAAFGQDDEAELVDLLRLSPDYIPELTLVAEEAGEIVGHVMVTWVPLHLDGGGRRDVLCVAPLAVRPDRQRRGIGRALLGEALRRADAMGEPFAGLEGDPEYYSRCGFVVAGEHGLRLPSPTVPAWAHQVYLLGGHDPALRGRITYPPVFWALAATGFPEPVADEGPYAVPWLFELAHYAGWIESVTLSADLGRAVPACPGWSVGDLLAHLGTVHRRAAGWVRSGRCPRTVPAPPPGPADGAGSGDALWRWYADGWRDLRDVLAAAGPETPAATWSPWEATLGFWRRRMVHETAVHSRDVLEALHGGDGGPGPDGGDGRGGTGAGDGYRRVHAWTVRDEVALDGIDEVLRLWLGTRLGDRCDGDGALVRVAAGGRVWTVGLHPGTVEVHDLPTAPDAVVSGAPAGVYAWLWGRAGDAAVTVEGDAAAVATLRRALAVATG